MDDSRHHKSASNHMECQRLVERMALLETSAPVASERAVLVVTAAELVLAQVLGVASALVSAVALGVVSASASEQAAAPGVAAALASVSFVVLVVEVLSHVKAELVSQVPSPSQDALYVPLSNLYALPRVSFSAKIFSSPAQYNQDWQDAHSPASILRTGCHIAAQSSTAYPLLQQCGLPLKNSPFHQFIV